LLPKLFKYQKSNKNISIQICLQISDSNAKCGLSLSADPK